MLRVRPGAGSRERNELAPGIRGIMTGIKTGGTRNLKGFGNSGGEYHYWDSDQWFYIDKQGNKIDDRKIDD